METINFTTTVLGRKASTRLKEHQVTQTIRTNGSGVMLAVHDRRVFLSDTIRISLDGKFVAYAQFTGIELVSWGELTEEDARRGGFDTRFELQCALKRAGYRFRLLDDYTLYRCRFTW